MSEHPEQHVGHTPTPEAPPRGDLEYHEWCRASLPRGWMLYGSTYGRGCTAFRQEGRYFDVPQECLIEIVRLTSENAALREIKRSAEDAVQEFIQQTIALEPTRTPFAKERLVAKMHALRLALAGGKA